MGRWIVGASKHGYNVEGEPWARDYYVECTCGWSETGISSQKDADAAGRAHLDETRDDQNWLDE